MAVENVTRAIRIERAALDKETATLPIAISSGMAIDGMVLEHSVEAIDLTRAANGGLPLLWNHNQDVPIGRITDIKLDADGVLRGVARFSKSARAAEILAQIEEDVLRDASVGARFDFDRIDYHDGLVVVRRWTPLECSIVSVPADASVGINRSHEGASGDTKMTEKVDLTLVEATNKAERSAAEVARRDAIDNVFEDSLAVEGVIALRKQAISEGWDALKASNELNTILRKAMAAKVVAPDTTATPLGKDHVETESRSATPSVSAGQADIDKFMVAAEEAILFRGRAVFDDEGKVDNKKLRLIRAENPYCNASLIDIVRGYADVARLDIRRDPIERGVARAMVNRAAGMGNADLPALVENIFNKMMMVPLTPAEENWRNLVRVSNLSDFKQTSRVNLGSASSLKEISNGGTIQRGYISDFKEYLTARTFGIELAVEYQTLRNDDVNALTGLPLEIRRKANRKVGDLVWAILTANPTLGADSLAVFHSTHRNLITSGAAPSVTTIEAAMAIMATQKAPSPTGDNTNDAGDALNIEPRYLLVPQALKGRALKLANSMYDPDAASGSQTANTVAGRFEVIADARLDTFNAAGWFLSADPNVHPTIEVGFVDGQETPVVMQENDWGTRGIKYAVWHDFDVKAMDYRGLVYNDGA